MKLLTALERLVYRAVLPLRRRSLRNRCVSIISNDCFSSFMYRFYGIPFNSPFAGLFIMPDDYIALLREPSVLDAPIRMTTAADSRWRDRLADLPDYPLGILPGGIEIHFLHYATADEARSKWTRRVPRIDWNNCIVKFSQNNGCTDEHLRSFDALPYPNKVAFTTHPVPGLKSVFPLSEFSGEAQLGKYWKIADLHYNFARHADSILDGKA